MALALKARRSGDPSHRQANAPLTTQELRLSSLMQRAAELLSAGADSKELRAALRAANITQAVDALPWSQHDAQIEQAVDTLESALTDAGVRVGDGGLPTTMSAGYSFNKTDPRALAWAQSQAAQLVREVSENTRAAIRGVIADAFRENLDIPQVVSRIRQTVGLTDKGSATVRRLHDRVLNELLSSGTPALKAGAQALKQAEAMRKRLIKTRAQTIARTEILRANNNGRYLGWTQAIESGFAPPNVMKKWSSTTASLSGIACERCRPMNGEIVAWDAPFTNGVNMPPAHPNCRCTALMVEPQPEQRKNPAAVNQETDYSTPAPKPIGVPSNAAGTNANLKKPELPEVGIPKERRTGMGDIPIPARELAAGSAGKFLLPDGTFTPERQALHDDIVARHLEGIRSVPKNQKPVYEMLGGGAGAGKSTVIKSGVADVKSRTQAVHINADDIKEMIPEVQDKIGKKEKDWAAFGHEESSYLAKRVMAASIESRKHVVLDGTGDGSVDSVLSKIASARRAGYTVKGTYVTVPTDVAVARAEARAVKSGRQVPSTVIRNTHAGVSKIFPQVASQFDEIVLVDNTIEPIVIARGTANKPLQILDQLRFNNFLGKSDPDFVPTVITPNKAGSRNAMIEAQVQEWEKFTLGLDDGMSFDDIWRAYDESIYKRLERKVAAQLESQGFTARDAQVQAGGELLRAKFYRANLQRKADIDKQVAGWAAEGYQSDVDKYTKNRKTAESRIGEALKEGKVTIAIDRVSLESVLKDGRFKTQFETKKSGGLLDPRIRKVGEVAALDLPTNTKPKDRPIYGYLTNNTKRAWEWMDRKDNSGRFWDNILSVNNPDVDQYGELRVVLKDSTRKRATVTIGDSLRTGVLADTLESEVHDLDQMGLLDKGAPTHTLGTPTADYLEVQVKDVTANDIDVIYAPSDMVESVNNYLDFLGIDIPVIVRNG